LPPAVPLPFCDAIKGGFDLLELGFLDGQECKRATEPPFEAGGLRSGIGFGFRPFNLRHAASRS
jgi:hypothetical protein